MTYQFKSDITVADLMPAEYVNTERETRFAFRCCVAGCSGGARDASGPLNAAASVGKHVSKHGFAGGNA
jgi:hypothetical protein